MSFFVKLENSLLELIWIRIVSDELLGVCVYHFVKFFQMQKRIDSLKSSLCHTRMPYPIELSYGQLKNEGKTFRSITRTPVKQDFRAEVEANQEVSFYP